jgi:PadR family transcriptional regulator PadR
MAKRLSLSTVAVLKAVADGNRFGLAVMRATGLPSGTVYPVLARAEDLGYVRGAWEEGDDSIGVGRPRRRYYQLTPSGANALRGALAHINTLAAELPLLQPE